MNKDFCFNLQDTTVSKTLDLTTCMFYIDYFEEPILTIYGVGMYS